MTLKLNDKVYSILKWICLIALPAIEVLLSTCGSIWGFNTEQIVPTIAAVATFIGALIGLSTYSYNKEDTDAGQQ